jgi:hypothetical protein
MYAVIFVLSAIAAVAPAQQQPSAQAPATRAGFPRFLSDPGVGPAASMPALAARTPAQLGLRFERNQGQQPSPAQFVSAPGAARFAFLNDRVELWSQDASGAPNPAVTMRMVGARKPTLHGDQPLPGRTNYFLGRDPKSWITDIATYQRVRYADVWPGIDMVFYGKAGEFEFDVLVGPGADPSLVRLAFDGATSTAIQPSGDLVIQTASGTLRHSALRSVGRTGHRSCSGVFDVSGQHAG